MRNFNQSSVKLLTFRTSFFRKGVLLSLISAFFLLNSCAPEEPTTTAEIDNYVEKVMNKIDIPGLAIAVVQDGEVVYSNAFGMRNIAAQTELADEHIFHMASVSKPFVATAIMQLVEQGKMKLDDPVTTYLSYFQLADDRYQQITIRQMLNHTSGMPDVLDYEWDAPEKDEGAAERYVRSLTTEKMIAAPGETWRYSNMAFDALGDVIAKVSGTSFEDYVKTNILLPLGMKQSSFLQPDIAPPLRTTPHVWHFKPIVSEVYPYNRRHAPSSTLNASVTELTQWMLANLNRGELDGKRILKAESYDILWQPSAAVNENLNVGLSWFIGNYKGNKIIFHSGGDTGYRSQLVLVPEKNIGVVLACNYDRAPTGDIRNGILDILLGETPQIPRLSIATVFAKVYAEEDLDAAKAHYHKLVKEAPDEYIFGDGELNRLGYFFLRIKQVNPALEIFKFNVELYPDVANTYDSLGEGYLMAGNKVAAIYNYKLSLEKDPGNDNAVEMLKKLGAD